MKKRLLASLLPIAFLAALTVGCGKTIPAEFQDLCPTTITIVQNGTPLEGASVALTPLGGAGLSAGGTTDAKGEVILYTQGEYKGAKPGKYRVSVVKESRTLNEDAAGGSVGGPPATPEQRKAMYTIRTFVDPKFTSSRMSPLEIEIKSGENIQTFDVGDPIDKVI